MARLYLLMALTAMCAAACASGQPNAAAPGPASVPSTGPPLIPPTTEAPTAGHPATQPSTATGGCSAKAAIEVHAGVNPAAICLPLHGILAVTAPASPRQPWSPLSSSNDTVLHCVSQPHPDGSINGTCTALQPGTATVSTVTSPFAGDPAGPQQHRWQLQVTVHGTT